MIESTTKPEAMKTMAAIANRIQSTLISNCLRVDQLDAHLAECQKYGFHAAMIPPCWVKRAASALQGTRIRTASFIDLHLGTMTTKGKAFEARQLAEDGVQEIDLMPNVGFLLSGMEREYFEDIRAVVDAVPGMPIKVMLELPLLNSEQKKLAVNLSVKAGVAYLKNASSGAVGIATPADMRYLRSLAPASVRLKASGGIKTARQVQELLDSGADLVGTSAAAKIMAELSGGQIESGGTTGY
jgi:deoxyribose-phosphate aldolase